MSFMSSNILSTFAVLKHGMRRRSEGAMKQTILKARVQKATYEQWPSSAHRGEPASSLVKEISRRIGKRGSIQ